MLKIFILALLFSLSVYAKPEAQCLKDMVKDTKHTEEQVTMILMTCNNQFIMGQHVFLDTNQRTDKIIRKRYPSSDPDVQALNAVSAVERALRLLDYSICERVTHLYQVYMKQCEAK